MPVALRSSPSVAYAVPAIKPLNTSVLHATDVEHDVNILSPSVLTAKQQDTQHRITPVWSKRRYSLFDQHQNQPNQLLKRPSYHRSQSPAMLQKTKRWKAPKVYYNG